MKKVPPTPFHNKQKKPATFLQLVAMHKAREGKKKK